MALDANTAGVITAAIPAVLELVKVFHSQAVPGAPALTDAQALAALQEAVKASLAKDDAATPGLQRATAAELGIHAGSTGE